MFGADVRAPLTNHLAGIRPQPKLGTKKLTAITGREVVEVMTAMNDNEVELLEDDTSDTSPGMMTRESDIIIASHSATQKSEHVEAGGASVSEADCDEV